MTTIIRRLSIAAILILSTNSIVAQESLIDVYQLALINDPLIREAEANYLATAEVKPQARSNLLPGLNLTSGKSHQFSESQSGAVVGGSGEQIGTATEFESDRENWAISLTQTVFDWGQYKTLRQAEKQVTQAETIYQAAMQDLLIRVAEAYFNVLAAEDTLTSEIAAREAIGRQLEQAQRRFEVGLIAITDVQESQAFYDQAIATEINAQRNVATRQEFLREIIAVLIPDLAGPRDDMPLQTPDPANAEQWVRNALGQNLNLLASRIAVDVAQVGIQIQRSARLPTLSFSAGYNESTTEQLVTVFSPLFPGGNPRPSVSAPEGYNWSFDLRVPLFTGGFNSSRIQQSVYQHRAAQESLERVARQTERETRDAYLGVISEISRVRALRQAVQSSSTALRAAEAGFEVGTRTTVDVLVSQQNLRLAETNYARSRYDYILNVLRLRQAAGGLSVEDFEQIDGWLQ